MSAPGPPHGGLGGAGGKPKGGPAKKLVIKPLKRACACAPSKRAPLPFVALEDVLEPLELRLQLLVLAHDLLV